MARAIFICGECEGAGAGLAAALDGRMPEGVELRVVPCMNVCDRPVTVAARGEGLAAYLFGDVTEAEAEGVVAFARAWIDAPGGVIADARPLGALRFRLIGRIPA